MRRVLLALLLALLLAPAPAAAQTETPTETPTATSTATETPTAAATPTPTAIPTVVLDFSAIDDTGETLLTTVFAAGDAGNPLQSLALAFGGMTVGFFVLSFIVSLIWRTIDD